jgi:hypothetical protein
MPKKPCSALFLAETAQHPRLCFASENAKLSPFHETFCAGQWRAMYAVMWEVNAPSVKRGAPHRYYAHQVFASAARFDGRCSPMSGRYHPATPNKGKRRVNVIRQHQRHARKVQSEQIIQRAVML